MVILFSLHYGEKNVFLPQKYSALKRIALLIALFAAVFFANITALQPDIMECRNLVTAHEIATDGNWLVPTMNGELRLEKPPLPTWIAAAVETVFGENLAAQRTMPALAATVLVIFFFLFARRLTRSGTYAFIASLLLLSCYNLIMLGRTATWDIYCHSFMMGAIYFLHRAFVPGKKEEDDETPIEDKSSHWAELLTAGGLMGLSFLSKGPISFYALLLPYLICLFYFFKPKMKGKWVPVVIAIVICAVISSWWYIALHILHPEATQQVVQKETGAWTGHNVRPIWYYWRFFVEVGAAAPLMLLALAIPYWKKRLRLKREYLFAISWVLITLVLLSAFPEKKYRYLLPILPSCCLAMAFLVLHWKERGIKWVYRAVVIVAGLWAVVCIAALPAIAKMFGGENYRSIAETRNIKQLDGIPFYCDKKNDIRIEFVYSARRIIKEVSFSDTTNIQAMLPCAVLTRERIGEKLQPKSFIERLLAVLNRELIGEEIPASLWQQADTTYIGQFDENHHNKKDKHYSKNLIYHLTLLTKKHSEQATDSQR